MLRNDGRVGSLYTAAGQRKYLTTAERSRFLTAAHSCPRADLRTLCLTLLHTGCRISEALALTPQSIERQAGYVAILAETHILEERDRRLWRFTRFRGWQLVKGFWFCSNVVVPIGLA